MTSIFHVPGFRVGDDRCACAMCQQKRQWDRLQPKKNPASPPPSDPSPSDGLAATCERCVADARQVLPALGLSATPEQMRLLRRVQDNLDAIYDAATEADSAELEVRLQAAEKRIQELEA